MLPLVSVNPLPVLGRPQSHFGGGVGASGPGPIRLSTDPLFGVSSGVSWLGESRQNQTAPDRAAGRRRGKTLAFGRP
jgi:hypothetical protein